MTRHSAPWLCLMIPLALTSATFLRMGHLFRRVELALLFLCLALPPCFLVAQSGPPSADQLFSVTGTVVNEATGEAIPHALVTLQGSPTRDAFSDSNGSFSIEGVAPGQHAISAQKPGYFGSGDNSGSYRAPLIVEAGPQTDPVTIKLEPENIIFGRLTDANGQPVESVSVRLTQRVVRNGKAHWEQKGWAQSDDEGGYRFANLQPGTYYLSAGPDAARADTLFAEPQGTATGWPGLYFPEAPDLASAAPIRVHSGQHFQADIIMNRVPLFLVSGVVSGRVPGRGFSLQVQNSSGEPVSVSTQLQHDSGRFEMHLPPGSYRLKATSDSGEQQLRAEIHLTVEHDLGPVQLALQPAVSLPIHVRMEDRGQNPSQRRSVGTYPRTMSGVQGDAAPPVSVHLIATNPGGADVYSSYLGAAGNRTFALRGIDPGRYTAEVSSYGGWYVESAQCGNTNLLNEDLVINAGTSCTVEVSLRNDSGSLQVTIKSSHSSTSGLALLVAVRGRAVPKALPFYNGQKQDAMTFTMTDIAPGDYLLYVFARNDAVEYSNPDSLQTYSSQATTVTISPDQTAKATAQTIRTGAASE